MNRVEEIRDLLARYVRAEVEMGDVRDWMSDHLVEVFQARHDHAGTLDLLDTTRGLIDAFVLKQWPEEEVREAFRRVLAETPSGGGR